MNQNSRRLLLLLISIILILPSCKQNDNPAPVNTDKIKTITTINNPGNFPDTTTTTITYNSNGTIAYADETQYGNTLRTTYTYTTSYIVVNQNQTGSSDYVRDSFAINSNGIPTYHYETISLDPTYNTEEIFFYSSNGQLAKTISSFPNIGQIDTIFSTWSNGDLIQQVSTLGEHDMAYGFNTGIPCQPGDALFVNQLLALGYTQGLNDHLVTAMDPGADQATITYTYDSQNRINGFTSVQSGKTNSIVSIGY